VPVHFENVFDLKRREIDIFFLMLFDDFNILYQKLKTISVKLN
jgi:hypothetical protein